MSIQNLIYRMNAKTKLASCLAVFVLASYFLYTFSLIPLLKQRKRLQLNLVSQQKLLKARQVSASQLDRLRSDLEALTKELRDVQGRFLTEDRLSSFFADVRKMAGKKNLDILIQVKQKQPLAEQLAVQGISCETLPVDMTLSGDYRHMISFLAELNKKPFLMNIARITIRAPLEESDIIEANLRLVVYVAHL